MKDTDWQERDFHREPSPRRATHSVSLVLSSPVSVMSNQLMSCFMMQWKKRLRMRLTWRPADSVQNDTCM